jgi:hypothetical protein
MRRDLFALHSKRCSAASPLSWRFCLLGCSLRLYSLLLPPCQFPHAVEKGALISALCIRLGLQDQSAASALLRLNVLSAALQPQLPPTSILVHRRQVSQFMRVWSSIRLSRPRPRQAFVFPMTGPAKSVARLFASSPNL